MRHRGRQRALTGVGAAVGLLQFEQGSRETVMAQAPSPPRLTCSVVAEDAASGVTLYGRIAGQVGAAGRYRLDVRKVGTGGSANIAQAGAFRVEPASAVTVGHVGLNLDRDSRYEAVLTLTVDGHTYTCEADGPGSRPL